MSEELNRKDFHEAIDTTLSGLQTDPWLVQRVINQEKVSDHAMKKRLPVGLVILIVLLLVAVTGLALMLLSPKDLVEQIVVPIAKQNDVDIINDMFSYDELVKLLRQLNENDFHLENDLLINDAVKNRKGYWEEETIMAICRKAFGGSWATWSIEEKYWYEKIMVAIGYKQENKYCLPGNGDMTVEEARSYAACKLSKKYGVELPDCNTKKWTICERFYLDSENENIVQNPVWEFEYINNDTNQKEYSVSFHQNGDIIEQVGSIQYEPEWIVEFDRDMLNPNRFTVEGMYEFDQKWRPVLASLIQSSDPYVLNSSLHYLLSGKEYGLPSSGDISRGDAFTIACDAMRFSKSTIDNILQYYDTVHEAYTFRSDLSSGAVYLFTFFRCWENDEISSKAIEYNLPVYITVLIDADTGDVAKIIEGDKYFETDTDRFGM